MKIYVGNLAFGTAADSLHSQFSEYGEVTEVAVVTDRQTGRSRGFAFVTMSNDGDARRAIEELNGTGIDGRTVVVNEARPRERDAPPPRRGGSGPRSDTRPRRDTGPRSDTQ